MPTGTGKFRIIELMASINSEYDIKKKPYKVFYCTSTRVLCRDMYNRLSKLDFGNVGMCFGKMTLDDGQVFQINSMTYEKLVALMKYGVSQDLVQWTLANQCNCIILDEFQNIRVIQRGNATKYIIEYGIINKITTVCLSGSMDKTEVDSLHTALGNDLYLFYSDVPIFTSNIHYNDKTTLIKNVINCFYSDAIINRTDTMIL
jgi:hypothetical protein